MKKFTLGYVGNFAFLKGNRVVFFSGRFSLIRNVKSRHGAGRPRVVKIIPYDPLRPDDCLRELELLKAVRQEHIVRLYEGYVWNDFVFLVYEKLFGENVARSLSLKNKYNEYHVTNIVKQVNWRCRKAVVHASVVIFCWKLMWLFK